MFQMYNNAYFIIENNDPGKQVVEEIWYTLENPNLLNTEKAGKGLGTKSDKRSKLDACLELQRVVDAEILTIHDGVTIAELQDSKNSSLTSSRPRKEITTIPFRLCIGRFMPRYSRK